MKTGRKAKNIIKKRFGSCVVQKKAHYKGNNLQYEALCDCGQTFFTSGQQLRALTIQSCPGCRGRKVRESKEVEMLKRLERIDIHATKYTLMDPSMNCIIKGKNGIHVYFCKRKAKIAARVIGDAVVIPLSEVRMIQKNVDR